MSSLSGRLSARLIERAHPLAQRLVGCWVFDQVSANDGETVPDLCARTHGSLVNSGADITAEVGALGRGFSFPSGSGAYRLNLGSVDSDHPLSFANAPGMTVIAGVRYLSPSSFPRIIDKSDGGSGANGWYFGTTESGFGDELEFYYNGARRLLGGSATDLNEGNDYVVGARVENIQGTTKTISLFNGGAFDSGTTTASWSTATTNAAIGQWNHSTTDRHWGGHIYWLHAWERDLTDQEMIDAWLDPRVIFWRPKPWIFFAGLSVGDAHTVAADDSSLSIGADVASVSKEIAAADSALSILADGSSFSQVHDLAVGNTAISVGVEIASTSKDLAANDAVLALPSESPGLSQIHDFVASDAALALQADQTTLSKEIAAADAGLVLDSESPAFAQVHNLTVAGADIGVAGAVAQFSRELSASNASIAVTPDTAAFIQAHSIVVADAAIALSAQTATFGTAGTHELDVDNAALGLTLDVASVSRELNAANSALSLVADTATVSRELSVLDATLSISAETTSVSKELAAADSILGMAVDASSFGQIHVFSANDVGLALSGQVAVFSRELAPDDASVGLQGDSTTFSQIHNFLAQDASIGLSFDWATFGQVHLFDINDASISLSADNVAISQPGTTTGRVVSVAARSDTINIISSPRVISVDARVRIIN